MKGGWIAKDAKDEAGAETRCPGHDWCVKLGLRGVLFERQPATVVEHKGIASAREGGTWSWEIALS
jgi:hypothetical protein